MTNRKSPTSFPMSLRWTSYVAPNPPKGASKTTIFSFSVQKIGLSSKKVCYKVSLCENFSGKVVRHSLAYLSVHKWLVGMSPCIWNFGSTWPTPFWNGAFKSIFARSSTSVRASEKSSIITNRKCTTRFPMSLTWTSYSASKLAKGGLKSKVTVFCRFSLGISKKVCYKVALCENCQQQSCKAFTGRSIRAQKVGGVYLLKCKFCS